MTNDSAQYLSLPSQRNTIGEKENGKVQKGCLSLSLKDFLVIETNVCSTKLTQNGIRFYFIANFNFHKFVIICQLMFIVELLGVLNWSDHVANGTLSQSLTSLQSVPGGEIVKFLQDILDALFSILTQVISIETLIDENIIFILF